MKIHTGLIPDGKALGRETRQQRRRGSAACSLSGSLTEEVCSEGEHATDHQAELHKGLEPAKQGLENAQGEAQGTGGCALLPWGAMAPRARYQQHRTQISGL